MVYKSGLAFDVQQKYPFKSMESTGYKLSTFGKSILIAVIYHLDKLNFLTFIENLAEYTETAIPLITQ